LTLTKSPIAHIGKRISPARRDAAGRLALLAHCRDMKAVGGCRRVSPGRRPSAKRGWSRLTQQCDGAMFETLKTFISDFVDGEKHPSQFADNDYRLAAAALLVHAAAIDGEMSQRERDKLHSVIKQRFALDDQTADELIAKATEAEHESVDLYHFTRLLNRSLDEPGRARVIEMMWEIVFADGQRDELEDNLLWRAADLLGVSPQERIELRRRIGGETS
jgi:uncharacterized tellurite resistance protein B-like protein